MSRLSSDTLFHFTKTEYLLGILENEFVPRWSLEEFTFNETVYKIGIPIICFCDIPLGQIHDHIKMYGHCGIGMKKKWGESNKLNPVIYIDKRSELSEVIYTIVDQLSDLYKMDNGDLFRKEISRSILEKMLLINSYCKMIDGISPKTGEYKKYYEEREWRYVPDLVGSTVDNYIIPEGMYSQEYVAFENEKIKNLRLEFEPTDINYIIIENEAERYNMINIIDSVKKEYSEKDRAILKSKIITSEQIFMDF
jgi:Putative abortive phage resistance protein AbiGi, antitoxin